MWHESPPPPVSVYGIEQARIATSTPSHLPLNLIHMAPNFHPPPRKREKEREGADSGARRRHRSGAGERERGREETRDEGEDVHCCAFAALPLLAWQLGPFPLPSLAPRRF